MGYVASPFHWTCHVDVMVVLLGGCCFHAETSIEVPIDIIFRFFFLGQEGAPQCSMLICLCRRNQADKSVYQHVISHAYRNSSIAYQVQLSY